MDSIVTSNSSLIRLKQDPEQGLNPVPCSLRPTSSEGQAHSHCDSPHVWWFAGGANVGQAKVWLFVAGRGLVGNIGLLGVNKVSLVGNIGLLG